MGRAVRYYLGFVAAFAVGRAAIGLTFGDDLDAELLVESLGFAAVMSGYWLAVNWRHVAPGRSDGRDRRYGQVIAGITTGVVLGVTLGNLLVDDDASWLALVLATTPVITAGALVATLVFVRLDWPPATPLDAEGEAPRKV